MSAWDVDQASSSFCYSSPGSRYVPDEETPLLQPDFRPLCVGNESERTSDLLEAAAFASGPGLEPGQPAKVTRVTSYSSSKAAKHDSDSKDGDHSIQPAENGSPYLCGVSRRRFWVLYAGVLLQYFVRAWEYP